MRGEVAGGGFSCNPLTEWARSNISIGFPAAVRANWKRLAPTTVHVSRSTILVAAWRDRRHLALPLDPAILGLKSHYEVITSGLTP